MGFPVGSENPHRVGTTRRPEFPKIFRSHKPSARGIFTFPGHEVLPALLLADVEVFAAAVCRFTALRAIRGGYVNGLIASCFGLPSRLSYPVSWSRRSPKVDGFVLV